MVELTLEQKVLGAYADGSKMEVIIESFNITYRTAIDILRTYKGQSLYKRTFTDDFKKMIAQRDINGIARRQIAEELDINVNTVKRACEAFGQSLKEKASSENAFTRIDGEFTMSKCPECGSKKVNEVDDKTIFCKKCGSEHIINQDYALKVNWEHLEE